MPAVTINLDDDTYQRLRDRAEHSHATLEDVVASLVREGASLGRVSEEFKARSRTLIDAYRPLLDRLGE